MKKGGFLRNVLDTIRSNQATGQSNRSHSGSAADRSLEFGGQLKPSHFALGHVARHGFTEHPTALAFDPVQKIAAIGTKSGVIRIFGRPGVDLWAKHEPAFAVTHMKFIVNQGAIITVTADESIHLWSLRGPNLKLQFSTSGSQVASGPSVSAACSPAPTPASNISSVSPQSGSSSGTVAAGVSSATSPSSFLGQITDTVTGAVDSASDFLSGGDHHQPTPSPTSSDPIARTHRQPELLHTLKFQREHITYIHQTLSSKWLYIGTERGNVHIANVETFELSGYSIAWNKAIELSRKTHPGAIIHLSECPQDTNKLLIGYESGCIVIWDLKQRNADGRYYHTENLLWLAWHYEGKQFVAAHGDGSLITWQTRSNTKPAQISYPHAKTASSGSGGGILHHQQQQDSSFPTSSSQQQQHHQSLASSIARSLNNELYRPINKVEWKASKSTNEQFLLFSGGLPYDNFDQAIPASFSTQEGQANALVRQSTCGGIAVGGLSPARFGSISSAASSQQQQTALKAGSMSPSISPNPLQQQQQQQESTRPGSSAAAPSRSQASASAALTQKEKKSLRSTSLTVMYGKSITVLEMDDTIVDFITVCDKSPYENDASDPYAVIVLLSNELILIDLTSSGYPSFDSPYPSASLNESPVTCIQYLADCTTDLIPFLYSSSQNAVSRAPKKGFSDKEWLINGGEWGQSMQSYPELVLTGHADGTIKFWDMSGINFDLISKIKTSKLFDRPNKLAGPIVFTAHSNGANTNNASRRAGTLCPGSPFKTSQQHSDNDQPSGTGLAIATNNESSEPNQTALDESLFAIEKIEFCPSTKRLLVAGAFSQVIQLKLNKKDAHASGASHELTTILVEPTYSTMAVGVNSQQQCKQHLLLRVRDSQSAVGSSSGGSSSSSSSYKGRGLSGFQPEIVCLAPLIVSSAPLLQDEQVDILGSISASSSATGPSTAYYSQIPPKISALAFQATHNILAYAHEYGIVLVDVIQKCLIMNATLSDLYGGTSMLGTSRDVSIQPFATSSILQHHYLATGSSGAGVAVGAESESSNNKYSDNGGSQASFRVNTGSDDGQAMADSGSAETTTITSKLNKLVSGGATPNGGGVQFAGSSGIVQNPVGASSMQQPIQSRYANNSMFQRQLSTNALNSSSAQNAQSAAAVASSDAQGTSKQSTGSRLFQRQMTASQLFSSGGSSLAPSGQQQQDGSGKRLLASIRADSSLASSAACLLGATGASGSQSTLAKGQARVSSATASATQARDGSAKKPAKNKRIISRMLSISAIHTSSSSSNAPAQLEHQIAASMATTTTTGYSSDDAAAQLNEPQTAGNGRGQQRFYAAGNEHQPDKFSDSSFTRSRSSSSSSTTANQQLQQAQAAAAAAAAAAPCSANESIQCIAFLDPAKAAPGATLSAAGNSQQPSGAQSSSGGAGSATSSKHKSLSSIDTNSGGQLALWVGTSSGAVLLVNLTLPDSEDNRILQLQSINAEPIPQASIKLSGQILCLAAFVCEPRHWADQQSSSGQQQLTSGGSLESTGLEACGSTSSSGAGGGGASAGAALSSSPPPTSSSITSATACGGGGVGGGQVAPPGASQSTVGSGASSAGADSRSALFFAVVSQKQARIYQVPASATGWTLASTNPGASSGSAAAGSDALGSSSSPPSQLAESPLCKLLANKRNILSECDLSDTSYACHAQLVKWRTPDEYCLVNYLATGNLVVHPLPRLKSVLLDVDFVPCTSPRVARSMCFSNNGHCLYQPCQGEICKFTLSSSYKALVNEMLGLAYVPREMPEQPRANFFKSLFSVSQASKQSDRDELFGECASGKASRNVAKHVGSVATSSGTDKLKSAAIGTMGHEMRVAREGLDERGERLGELEDRTLNLLNQSESYSQAAHQLAQKFKDKKWYQF